MLRIVPPSHSGFREQAQELVAGLASDLTRRSVLLDCAGLTVSSPSFLDEVVKQVLVQGKASVLDVHSASERTRALLEPNERPRTGRLRIGSA